MPNLFKRWDGSNWITIFDDTRSVAVLSLTTNWGAYGSGYDTPKVNLVGGRAYLSGLIKNNTGTTFASGAIATVPALYKPLFLQAFSAMCSNPAGCCRIDVNNTTGAITLNALPAVTVLNGRVDLSRRAELVDLMRSTDV